MRLWDRLMNSGYGMKAAGAFGVMLEFIVTDAFFWLFCILIFANVGDWFAGRLHARYRDDFDSTESRHGMYEKAIAMMVVLIVRSLEAVLVMVIGVSTQGWAASAIVAALIYEDLESMDKHRSRMGKKPIPLLSATISKMRNITGGERRSKPRTNDVS